MRDYKIKDYVLTKKQTGKIMYECLFCGEHMIYMATTGDGRKCLKCNGQIEPIGYAIKEDSNE